MNSYTWKYAKEKYCTYQAAIREAVPEALKDPLIAAAVAQADMVYLAIDARMAQLAAEDAEE